MQVATSRQVSIAVCSRGASAPKHIDQAVLVIDCETAPHEFMACVPGCLVSPATIIVEAACA